MAKLYFAIKPYFNQKFSSNMRVYQKKNKNTSHALDSNPKASKQASLNEILQTYSSTQQTIPQQESNFNNTGLPDNLKTGIENLSGYNMDDVKVHYNSEKPTQLQAMAYTQGTDIHIAPGQEKHLPHEAWHVVQQKQGRVYPTTQLKGVDVNDNEGLEREADKMGAKALLTALYPQTKEAKANKLEISPANPATITQRMAIMTQEIPDSQSQKLLFDKLKNYAKNKLGLGEAIDKDTDKKLTDDENIGFLGHASPAKIGDLSSQDVVNVIKNKLSVQEGQPIQEDTIHNQKITTTWNGTVFLLGCSTGQAYDTGAESLAEAVKSGYNEKISPEVKDVVGTFTSLYMMEGDTAKIAKAKKEIFEGDKNEEDFKKDKEWIDSTRTIGKVFGTISTVKRILNIYVKTTEITDTYPIQKADSIPMRTECKDKINNLVVNLPSLRKKIENIESLKEDKRGYLLNTVEMFAKHTTSIYNLINESFENVNELSQTNSNLTDIAKEANDSTINELLSKINSYIIWSGSKLSEKVNYIEYMEINFSDPDTTYHTTQTTEEPESSDDTES